ncbi:hypothetical protein Bphy_2888 [Paraburkholderia phymatum STM815]|uniref:Uncharacterized protein n=1 Tax=Paraburkholderia phymatum (strain DSM 17167 / CIP 108236 / LMG 21445 / STM815) TaxID=391038 RepID=B2JIL4_PARP8|nr:hypothetical protein Bphy_2888 [Paraburkholderia phymatum STM815]
MPVSCTQALRLTVALRRGVRVRETVRPNGIERGNRWFMADTSRIRPTQIQHCAVSLAPVRPEGRCNCVFCLRGTCVLFTAFHSISMYT